MRSPAVCTRLVGHHRVPSIFSFSLNSFNHIHNGTQRQRYRNLLYGPYVLVYSGPCVLLLTGCSEFDQIVKGLTPTQLLVVGE